MGRTVWAREHRNPALAGSTPAGPTSSGCLSRVNNQMAVTRRSGLIAWCGFDPRG
nr:MAG TPA: hypothetical protein [Caudoviricetes sp.]